MVQTLQAKDINLTQLEENFGLKSSTDAQFFWEWQTDLPMLSSAERQNLDQVKTEFAYLAKQDVLEPIVKLVVLAPLLRMAGFFQPPFRITAEKQVEIMTEDEGLVVRGLIDFLVFREQIWVVTIEAKRAEYSLKVALPQMLLYMLASPSRQTTQFGLITNGSEFRFAKLVKQETPLYRLSDLLAIDNHQDLYTVAQVLKQFRQLAQS
jgi:Type I restriction enzyme R protein N terminus (HSDR_N)